jgi:hypothetical protein
VAIHLAAPPLLRRAREKSRVEGFERASALWADTRRCLIGEALDEGETVLERVRAIEVGLVNERSDVPLALRWSTSPSGWPGRCAPHVAKLYDALVPVDAELAATVLLLRERLRDSAHSSDSHNMPWNAVQKPPSQRTMQSPGFGRDSTLAGAGRYPGAQAQSASVLQRTLPFQPETSHDAPSALHEQDGPSAADGAWAAPTTHAPLAGSKEQVSFVQGRLVPRLGGPGAALEAGVSLGSLPGTSPCAIGGGAVAWEVEAAVEAGAFGLVHAPTTTSQLARQRPDRAMHIRPA